MRTPSSINAPTVDSATSVVQHVSLFATTAGGYFRLRILWWTLMRIPTPLLRALSITARLKVRISTLHDRVAVLAAHRIWHPRPPRPQLTKSSHSGRRRANHRWKTVFGREGLSRVTQTTEIYFSQEAQQTREGRHDRSIQTKVSGAMFGISFLKYHRGNTILHLHLSDWHRKQGSRLICLLSGKIGRAHV